MSAHRRQFALNRPLKDGGVQEALYPLQIVVYRADGSYTDPRPIPTAADLNSELTGPVTLAIRMGYEVKVTDARDRLCLHAKEGRMIYPPLGQPGGRKEPVRNDPMH